MKHVSFAPCIRSSALPFLIAVIASFLLSGFAQAAPLTDDQIESFIDSLSDTEKLGEEYPELDYADERPVDMSRPLSSALQELDNHPEARSRLEDVVQDHGFGSVREWAETGDRIYVAMMAIGFREMPAEQRETMKNTPAPDLNSGVYANMPEDQKAKIQQMADTMRGAINAADNAPEEDIEAVRPFRTQLEATMAE